ncbi:MAG: ABC transporter substrate-binding protein, partial [Bacillota bacterium]
MKRKYFSILLALLLVLVVSIVACGKKTETNPEGTGDQASTKPTKTIKVGLIMPMSGPGSLWGEDIKRDADAYAAVLNDEGGVKIGDEYYSVENFYANDEGLPEKAALAATQLVEKDGVAVIVGYWGGGLPTMN